jgi:hypothetical protein
MAGLLSGGARPQNQSQSTGAAPAQGQGAPPPAQQQGGDMEGEASNVTPEEQAQYDQFVNNALEIIYPQQSQGQPSPAIMQGLAGQMDPQVAEMFAQADPPVGNSPIDNLAATGVSLVLMVEASAAQANAAISDDVLYHAGADILAELAEVAEAAKIHEYPDAEMESALYRALDLYRVSSPRVDPERLKQEFGQIVEADKAGQLDQLLPGIGQRMGGRA